MMSKQSLLSSQKFFTLIGMKATTSTAPPCGMVRTGVLPAQCESAFAKGALFPVHDDGSITAINWADIANGLDLTLDCTQ